MHFLTGLKKKNDRRVGVVAQLAGSYALAGVRQYYDHGAHGGGEERATERGGKSTAALLPLRPPRQQCVPYYHYQCARTAGRDVARPATANNKQASSCLLQNVLLGSAQQPAAATTSQQQLQVVALLLRAALRGRRWAASLVQKCAILAKNSYAASELVINLIFPKQVVWLNPFNLLAYIFFAPPCYALLLLAAQQSSQFALPVRLLVCTAVQ